MEQESSVQRKTLPVLIPTMSKDMNEDKVIDVVDRVVKRLRVTLLRHNVEKPERSYAQVRCFAKKKDD